jgi:hypothetical protein
MALKVPTLLILSALVAVLVGSTVYVRKTTRDVDRAMALSQRVWAIGRQQTDIDGRQLQACVHKGDAASRQVRDCLVGLSTNLTDWRSATAAARKLALYLRASPEDIAAREAGIVLMDRAWKSWFTNYQPAISASDAAWREALVRNPFLPLQAGTQGHRGATVGHMEDYLRESTELVDAAVTSPEAATRLSVHEEP